MKEFTNQCRVHFKRLIARNLKSMIASLVFPIFFYILYSSVFVSPMTAEALTIWQTDYLVSMIIYGITLTPIMIVSNALLTDHLNHFDLFVTLSPEPKWRYTLSVVLVYIPVYLTLIVLLGLAAFIVNGITLSIIQWLSILIGSTFAVIPFSLIGIMISYAGSSTMVTVLGNLITFPLSILGGLWWPLDFMPAVIRSIGQCLPTYQIATLTRQLVHGAPLELSLVGQLGLWILLLGGLTYIIQLHSNYKEPQFV